MKRISIVLLAISLLPAVFLPAAIYILQKVIYFPIEITGIAFE